MMIRSQVHELAKLGSFPSSQEVDLDLIRKQEQLLSSIERPVSNDEARELIKLFGPDDYYGLIWTVPHLVETAPGWPLTDCLTDNSNEWIATLKLRIANKQRLDLKS